MCPGSQPAMQNTATTLATRMIKTIQAKISSPLIAPSRKRYAIRISAAAYKVASLIGGEVHFEIAPLYLGGGPRTSRSPRPRTMIGGMSEKGHSRRFCEARRESALPPIVLQNSAGFDFGSRFWVLPASLGEFSLFV
jgi:hypothetical protein